MFSVCLCLEVFALIFSYVVGLQVYTGLTDVTKLNDPLRVSSVHVHPDYNNADGADYNNDIALIKLQDPITFSSSVMPVCLPERGATYATGVLG